MNEEPLILKLDDVPDSKNVKVTTAGNTVNIKRVSNKNYRQTVQRISADEMLVISTGEIKQVQHSESRADNTNSLRKTLALGRDLINANVTNPSNLRWVTLTYAENMTDVRRLYFDVKNFHLRLNRYLSKHGMKKPEYIEQPEPQERGAWHMHELLIWNETAPYIPNCELRDVWGFGFVKINKVPQDCDNIGAYLTPYLTDLELDPTKRKTTVLSKNDIVEREVLEDGKKVRKKFIKGGRLALYPAGMHMFRHSRGIKKPLIEQMTMKQAKEKVSGATKTFEKSIVLQNDKFTSVVINAYYNTKRN